MFNKEKILSFDDPQTEKWFSTIKDVVYNNTMGITNTETKEATRLTAGLTSLTTSLVPLKPNSERCEDATPMGEVTRCYPRTQSFQKQQAFSGGRSRSLGDLVLWMTPSIVPPLHREIFCLSTIIFIRGGNDNHRELPGRG